MEQVSHLWKLGRLQDRMIHALLNKNSGYRSSSKVVHGKHTSYVGGNFHQSRKLKTKSLKTFLEGKIPFFF